MTYVNSAAVGTQSAAAAAAPAVTGTNQLDNSQTFLNLLVAQLKNQNPDNPTDPTSFMTEIAQLTQVQSSTALNSMETTVAADSMIGQDITGNDTSGAAVTGKVSGVTLSSSGPPTLQVTDATGQAQNISLSAVTQVYAAASAPATSSSTTSTVA